MPKLTINILIALICAVAAIQSSLLAAQTSIEKSTDKRIEELLAKSPLAAGKVAKRDVIDGSNYSPYNQNIPQQVFWGDTHLHSSMSIDANSAGNEKLSPAEAYRFAMGEKVTANNGKQVRLNRPLDFLVVADHAEYLGVLSRIRSGDPTLQTSEQGRNILAKLKAGKDAAIRVAVDMSVAFIESDNRYPSKELSFDTWKSSAKIADDFNKPGQFTALIGYEWTYFPNGDNLHRVVLYRDGADKAASIPPFSSLDGVKPEQLWAFMADYETTTGGEILAIPHNGNVSNGRMFTLQDSDGNAVDKAYTQTRQRWEPVVEVTQIKGDGEAHPFLSPDDEFADFETWDKGNLNPFGQVPKTKDMLQYEYARSALKLGLEAQRQTGFNPFKFGMIGSTDAHTSLATAEENNFWGKASAIEPGAERSSSQFFPAANKDGVATYSWEQVASGYAAVWAYENTREAIFDAIKRKEVYATTGSRMTVRFFGGWDYQEDDAFKPDNARIGYAGGVPMGGDLPVDGLVTDNKAPRFLVTAVKDVDGANLDRIQIIKGWQDAAGELHEKVYNVAVSSERKIRGNKVKAVRSTVDLEAVSYSNTVGNAQLAIVWEDPDFKPEQAAFYYARVLEIPTPRWTEYDRVKFGYEVPEDAPREIQDRAYTSPIWYTPREGL